MSATTDTTWREEARALKAANPDMTNAEIGRRVGRTRSAVCKVLNPDRAAEWRRQDNARRHEAKLAWQREKDRSPEGRGACERCGGLRGHGATRGGGRLCQGCIEAAAAERAALIIRLWHEGVAMGAIAEAVGTSVGTLAVDMHRLRERGADLPYRRTPEQVERIRAGRWGVAA